MKPILPWLLAATLPLSLHAVDFTSGRLSGDRLIQQWTAPSARSFDRNPAALRARAYADGYLAGVADASEGTAWCNTRGLTPRDMDLEIIAVLKSLPDPHTRRTVAAELVTRALATRFPCR